MNTYILGLKVAPWVASSLLLAVCAQDLGHCTALEFANKRTPRFGMRHIIHRDILHVYRYITSRIPPTLDENEGLSHYVFLLDHLHFRWYVSFTFHQSASYPMFIFHLWFTFSIPGPFIIYHVVFLCTYYLSCMI